MAYLIKWEPKIKTDASNRNSDNDVILIRRLFCYFHSPPVDGDDERKAKSQKESDGMKRIHSKTNKAFFCLFKGGSLSSNSLRICPENGVHRWNRISENYFYRQLINAVKRKTKTKTKKIKTIETTNIWNICTFPI